MSKPIDFYFDFSSSYSYVAHREIMELARKYGRSIVWKPIALGAIFKAHGHMPPLGGGPKSDYVRRDVERSAALNGLAYSWPEPFPFNSISAARIFWYLATTEENQAWQWAIAVFDASFGQGRDCSSADVLGEVALAMGLDSEELLAAANQDHIKQQLKAATTEAMERGVFGAPTFFVDGEMFWGADRMNQMERQLRQGD